VIRDLSALLLAASIATAATGQTPPQAPSSVLKPKAATCAECGVVRSVKRIEAATRPTAQERESTAGFVASVPLGGGKSSVGSVTDVRREATPPVVSYEIVVRLDDGRFQVVTQADAGSLREGDKVRIDRGKVVLRDK
jgi:outer membrane lipoprotein SlyB